jgi:hypothetical protein
MLQSERYFANLLVAHIGDATKQSAPQSGAFSKLQDCCNSTTLARKILSLGRANLMEQIS